jgi:ribonuclease D
MLGVELSKKQQTSDWGIEKLSDKQMEYAASDVLYLHRLKEKFDEMLRRENRTEIFNACVKFLPSRSKLDLQGFISIDIFSH